MDVKKYFLRWVTHSSPSKTATPGRVAFSWTTVNPSDVTSTLPADDTAVKVT
jgi:hypothetical protein